ncbi:MAG: hydroxymethylglutaryl-CoA lyase, partial [Pedobacter sp.]
ISNTRTKLLTIIANERGAQEAVTFDEVSYLGFPFSISETFQQRNANSTIQQSLERVEEIQNLCIKNQKELVVYISMGFGNPYGDPYDEAIVVEWVNKLVELDIKVISLADTVGLATPQQVDQITSNLISLLSGIEIGVHLHSTATGWKEKADAALKAGCLRFDGAIKGIGGCPMAGDELVGNMDTEKMILHFRALGILPGINEVALAACSRLAADIFI